MDNDQPAPDLDPHEPCMQMLAIYATFGPETIAGRARALELSLARPVTCAASPEMIPEPERSALMAAMGAHKPRAKLCHDNAWRICAFEGDPFSLVSGYASSIIPIEHSWIRIATASGPIDFDPTDWGVFGGGQFSGHVQTFCLDHKQASQRAIDTGHSGPWREDILFEMLGVPPIRRVAPSTAAKPRKKAKP